MISLFIAIFIILILSAFISLAESSILSLNKTKFYIYKKEHQNSKRVSVLEKIIQNKSEYISSIVILSTFFNVGGSVVIGSMTAEIFKPFNPIIIESLSLHINPNTLFAIIFTLTILYFSKMIPKLIGAQAPLRISLFVALPIWLLSILIKPITLISHKMCSPFIQRKEDSGVTLLEIKHIIRQGFKKNIIKEREYEIINNSLLLNQKQVKDIMKEKKQIESASASLSIKDNIDMITNLKHKRIVVCIGEKNDIPSGIVVVSDLLLSFIKGENKTIGDFAHKLLIVNENDTLGHIVADFSKSIDHLALVQDENEDYVGIIAIEDIFDNLALGFDH